MAGSAPLGFSCVYTKYNTSRRKICFEKKNISFSTSNANLMLSIELTDFLERKKNIFFSFRTVIGGHMKMY